MLALALVGIAASGWWWLSSQIARFEETLAAINEQLASLEATRISARSGAVMLETRRADLEKLRMFFADKDRPIAFIEAIEELARRTGTTATLTIAEGVNTSDAVPFKMIIEGREDRALAMLKLVELMPYQIAITDLSFQRSTRNDERAGGTITRFIVSFSVKTTVK